MNKQTLFYVVLFILTALLFKQFFFDTADTGISPTSVNNKGSIPQYQDASDDDKVVERYNDNQGLTVNANGYITEDSAIITCESLESASEQSDTLSPFEQEFEQLLSSSLASDKLILAVFSSILTNRNRLKFLAHYNNIYPQDKFAHYHLLNACHHIPKSQLCQRDFSEQANSADSDNGMLWVVIAGLHLKQGDEASALNALRTAADKGFYSDYTFESAIKLSESIAPYSDNNYNQTTLTAFDYVSTFQAQFGSVFEYCLTSDSSNIELFDACFQLGTNMHHNSRTVMLASLGSSLIQEMYLLEQNESAAQALEKESNTRFTQRFNDDAQKATSLMLVDESLTRLWLQIGLEQGESVAIEQVIQEAKWKSQDPNYNPCPM